MAEAIQFNLILPVGTQVVTRIAIGEAGQKQFYPYGAVGVIVKAPRDNRHAYRVQFPDGGEVSLARSQLTIRKNWQKEGLLSPESSLDQDLNDYVIYRCIVGSKAFGLDHAESDTDRRGIYLPPASWQWSLYGVPEQLDYKDTEECYWELQKFLTLALKANPNVLECLYTPLVEMVTPLAAELLEIREIFLSKLIYQTYNGYVMSQFKKLEQDIRNHQTIKWKHAMHLIRLLLSGITVLKHGFVPVKIDGYRADLLAIRRGEVSWQEVNQWRLGLHSLFDRVFVETKLPERPNYAKANDFLIKARRSVVEAI
jgi:predicted nucleotidyltransferase